MKVTRKIEECFEGVLRVFQGIVKMFPESVIDEEVLRMFRGRFMIFMGVCRVF